MTTPFDLRTLIENFNYDDPSLENMHELCDMVLEQLPQPKTRGKTCLNCKHKMHNRRVTCPNCKKKMCQVPKKRKSHPRVSKTESRNYL